MASDRLTDVLDAAYECLARYGTRRTTMDDIASSMGVSRSAVYQYVRNKDEAFRLLAERLHARALDRAGRAAAADLPPARRIEGIAAAKFALERPLSEHSPHTAELVDERARLFGGICQAFTADLRALFSGVFAEAGTRSGLGPGEAAEICLALVKGLESAPGGEDLLRPAVRVLAEGLLAPAGART
ncbi:TetR family transcriptional regulator [Nocardiopsis sp. Huas11]|uniref:TetR/AcrR family transcriptional regulator n=1 Tax=Nocardiopsis sp. Huas11 TaxID=2183912 RepID=UPI000EAE7169|nr:TetR/AcrR family transcriptional regulator [Nocardiopsis sp. Huas11]RKS04746.1 TetR family transcriptional regulator [Nocardiopsis sp. Huas11]